MATQPTSILALALDQVWTRASLFERCDGTFRFVAQGVALTSTSGETPDASRGAAQAIAQLSRTCGRIIGSPTRLADAGPERAVDLAILTIDLPLKVSVIGLGTGAPLEDARLAVASTQSILVDEVPVTSAAATNTFLKVSSLVRDPANDVIVICADLIDPPLIEALGDALESGCVVGGLDAPSIILHCPDAASAPISKRLREHFRIATVSTSQGTAAPLALREQLLAVWRERAADAVPGYRRIADCLTAPALPARVGLARALDSLAALDARPVWLVSSDHAGVTLWQATPTTAATPVAASVGRSTGFMGRPWAIPETPAELKAIAADLANALDGLPDIAARPGRADADGAPRRLIAAGNMARQLDAASLVELLSRSLELTGLWTLGRDGFDLLPSVGALAAVESRAAADLLLGEAAEPVATLIVPVGEVPTGQSAIELSGTTSGGQVLTGQVLGGQRLVVPLAIGDSARATARPTWRASLGRGRLRSLSLDLLGSVLGVVLDARSRAAAANPGPPKPAAVTAALSASTEIGALVESAETVAPSVDRLRPPVTLEPPTAPVGDRPAALARTRALPWNGRIVVSTGDAVGPTEPIGEALAAQEPVFVGLASGLGLGEADPTPHLARHPGDTVAAGDLLASRSTLFGLRKRQVTAPIEGTIIPGSLRGGQLAISPSPRRIVMNAHLPGRVVATSARRSVTIELTGLAIQGTVSFGGEATGPLRFLADPSSREGRAEGSRAAGRRGLVSRFEGSPGAAEGEVTRPAAGLSDEAASTLTGAILVVDVLGDADLDRAIAAGVAGIICGSIDPAIAAHLERLAKDDGCPCVVATEGWGLAPLPILIRSPLGARQGQFASIRAASSRGYHRLLAEVILPARASGEPVAPATPRLQVGATVRVVAGELIGQLGIVSALPEDPIDLPTGLVAAAADVTTSAGTTFPVARANLEVLASA